MFSPTQFDGSLLPTKTLCLTFDDGPGETIGNGAGPRTIELAGYLLAESIPATFFMVGRHIAKYPQLVQQVVGMGFTVGNHTYNHPDFLKPETFYEGATATTEISSTEGLLKKYYPHSKVYFRAPYGSWSGEVAYKLNTTLKTEIEYIGPIGWDINENDWRFWLEDKSPEACANAYLQTIVKTKRGIIVLHDSTSDNDTMRLNNKTCQTVKILVPQLKQLGYTFIGLNDVPGIR